MAEQLARTQKLIHRIPTYLLAPIERSLVEAAGEPAQPQLFILGLPRSGTTLVYQYLVHRLQLSYFTNGADRFHLAPCLITKWRVWRHGTYVSEFESSYGEAPGLVAPHEAGAFWGRFFGYEGYVTADEISEHESRLMRSTVACIERTFGGVPFVNKNVKHLLRVDALGEIFPEAVFLIVERDMEDVILSWDRARRANLSDLNHWWSVRPPVYQDLLDRPQAERLPIQLHRVRKRMETELGKLAKRRVHRIQYESFCDSPESLAQRVRDLFDSVGYRNGPRNRFSVSSNQPQTPEERHLIKVLQKTLD